MTAIHIGPCEHRGGCGGCVRDTYLEALRRAREKYGKDNVSGGPLTNVPCHRKDVINSPV